MLDKYHIKIIDKEQRYKVLFDDLNDNFERPASVAQWAETQCAPKGQKSRGGVQSPGWPVDFVFGFQGCML